MFDETGSEPLHEGLTRHELYAQVIESLRSERLLFADTDGPADYDADSEAAGILKADALFGRFYRGSRGVVFTGLEYTHETSWNGIMHAGSTIQTASGMMLVEAGVSYGWTFRTNVPEHRAVSIYAKFSELGGDVLSGYRTWNIIYNPEVRRRFVYLSDTRREQPVSFLKVAQSQPGEHLALLTDDALPITLDRLDTFSVPAVRSLAQYFLTQAPEYVRNQDRVYRELAAHFVRS